MPDRGAEAPSRNSRRDPELTQREILDAATEEFAEHGPKGARTEDIAERTNTSKRMIFYYFGSKEGLYRAVLRENYKRIRSLEASLSLDGLPPAQAMRELVRASQAYYEDNPGMARIVAMENLIMHGATARTIEGLVEMNRSAIDTIESILVRGQRDGSFRSGPGAPSALDVHQVMWALILNRIEHQWTFKIAFGRDMLGAEEGPHVRRLVEDTVMRLVLVAPEAEGVDAEGEGLRASLGALSR